MAIYSGFTHWKWWFSIVMWVYQRVKWTPQPHTLVACLNSMLVTSSSFCLDIHLHIDLWFTKKIQSLLVQTCSNPYYLLVGGWALPLWKKYDFVSWDDEIPNVWKTYDFVSWDDEIPNIWKVIIHSCSKPPISFEWLSRVRSLFSFVKSPPNLEVKSPPFLLQNFSRVALARPLRLLHLCLAQKHPETWL